MTPEGKLFLDALRGAMIAKHFSIEEAIDHLADTEIDGQRPHRLTHEEVCLLDDNEYAAPRGPFESGGTDVVLARGKAAADIRLLIYHEFDLRTEPVVEEADFHTHYPTDQP